MSTITANGPASIVQGNATQIALPNKTVEAYRAAEKQMQAPNLRSLESNQQALVSNPSGKQSLLHRFVTNGKEWSAPYLSTATNALGYVGSNLYNSDVASAVALSAVTSFLTLKTERGASWVGPRNGTTIKTAIVMASALSVATARALVSGDLSTNEVAIRAGWNALCIVGFEAAIAVAQAVKARVFG